MRCFLFDVCFVHIMRANGELFLISWRLLQSSCNFTNFERVWLDILYYFVQGVKVPKVSKRAALPPHIVTPTHNSSKPASNKARVSTETYVPATSAKGGHFTPSGKIPEKSPDSDQMERWNSLCCCVAWLLFRHFDKPDHRLSRRITVHTVRWGLNVSSITRGVGDVVCAMY